MLCWRWSGDFALRCLWRWLDVMGWKEEESVRQVSSNLTSLHAISLFRWLFVTVNYFCFFAAVLLQNKEAGVWCQLLLFYFLLKTAWSAQSPFFLRCGYSNEQFQRKTGQCTVTASKELKQQDVIFPLSPVLSKHITDSTNLDTRTILVWLHSVTAQ